MTQLEIVPHFFGYKTGVSLLKQSKKSRSVKTALDFFLNVLEGKIPSQSRIFRYLGHFTDGKAQVIAKRAR